jgi:uncharacterized membrane protein
MPFCTNCGTQVDPGAAFCHRCGTAQRATARDFGDVLGGISDRTACILCYVPVFGIIPAILFLASHKFRTNYRVRFDAFQAVYLFVAWLLVNSAGPTLLFSGFPGDGLAHAAFEILKAALVICWIFLLVKAAHEQQIRLPILGDLAARSTHEQL